MSVSLERGRIVESLRNEVVGPRIDLEMAVDETRRSDHIGQHHVFRENVRRAREPQMYANILLSTDGSDVARKGVEHGMALAKALNAKVTVITVTEPPSVGLGSGHAGWIPTQEMIDSFDVACKERAEGVIDEVRAMAKQIGMSVELLHVPNAHPATAVTVPSTIECPDCHA